MIGRFQGKGLVPPELIADPDFLGAVALAAGVTLLLACIVHLPLAGLLTIAASRELQA